MATPLPKPELFKTLFRADFTPPRSYLMRFAAVANDLSGYPGWESDSTNAIKLSDPTRRRSARMDPACFIFNQDSGDEALEIESIGQMLSVWPKGIGIEEFRRLGLRRKYLIPLVMSYSALISVLSARLLQSTSLRSIFPGIYDIATRFDCAEGSSRMRVGLLALSKPDLFASLEFDPDLLPPSTRHKALQDIIAAFPDNAVMVDLDFHRSSDQGSAIRLAECDEFLTTARAKIRETVGSLCDHLFSP